jgi:ABC-type bacteriocin/lantibiotic exporter with double-glycine peptidase domain
MLQMKQMSIMESIEQRFFVRSSFDLAARIPHVRQESISEKYMPEMMNRFFEIMTIQKGITKLVGDFSTAIIQIFFGMLLLGFYHPLFVLLGIALMLLLFLIFKFTGSAGLQSSIDESTHKFSVAHWLEEVSRTLNTFKLSGNSSLPLEETDKKTFKYLTARQKHFKVLMMQYKTLIAFKLLVAGSLIIIGSILVIQGQINIGQFVAAEIIILLVINSVEKIILNMSTVYDVLTALEKVGAISDIPLERAGGKSIPMSNEHGLKIKVQNLTIQHHDSKKNIFEPLNFELLPGQKLCLTGPSGSGKTTLMRLISGLYEKYQGTIVINDLPLIDLDLNQIRSAVGENYSGQEIFKSSILNNITCGVAGVGVEQAIEASRRVGLDDYIQSLERGYETILDPEGKRLASSVARKIILARAIVGKPRLLLLEDFESGLVNSDRIHFTNYLFEDCKNVTSIIISNDPEVQRRCDLTIYMEPSN